MVPPTGIEPVSSAEEALVLSIELRGEAPRAHLFRQTATFLSRPAVARNTFNSNVGVPCAVMHP